LKEKAFRINKNVEILLAYGDKIKEILKDLDKIMTQEERAIFIQEKTRKITEDIREISDKLENEISRENYSVPRYVDMLKSL
ncbi:MAG: glutamine synthetase, partial [Anaerococcus hydrogenalis]|nr:glutamine synthetase [Anaerococcus hydrogenalis]